jgi:hypothetical protein
MIQMNLRGNSGLKFFLIAIVLCLFMLYVHIRDCQRPTKNEFTAQAPFFCYLLRVKTECQYQQIHGSPQ